jgi:hypothetical protein
MDGLPEQAAAQGTPDSPQDGSASHSTPTPTSSYGPSQEDRRKRKRQILCRRVRKALPLIEALVGIALVCITWR